MPDLTIRLIHWHAGEAEPRISALSDLGYRVAFEPFTPKVLRGMKNDPPAAVVIDLSRLPSQGRDVGLHIRKTMSTTTAH